MPTRVALGDHFKAFVRDQRDSSRFNNASDALRAEIAAGLASGPRKPAREVFDRLQAKYRARAQASRCA